MSASFYRRLWKRDTHLRSSSISFLHRSNESSGPECLITSHRNAISPTIAAELVPLFLAVPEALIWTVSRNVDWRFGYALVNFTLCAMKRALIAAFFKRKSDCGVFYSRECGDCDAGA